MSADPGPLLAIAAELDRHADLLDRQAALVAAAPARACWSSEGARAWAEAVGRVRSTLIAAEHVTRRAAAQFRTAANRVTP